MKDEEKYKTLVRELADLDENDLSSLQVCLLIYRARDLLCRDFDGQYEEYLLQQRKKGVVNGLRKFITGK